MIFDDSQLTNYLVRMVVPMRREFGRKLDVTQFLHDLAYAREVLDEALTSRDTRLREYADYVEKRLRGPRIADGPAPEAVHAAEAPSMTVAKAARPAAAPAPRSAVEAAASGASEEELRARMMKKYTTGLR